MIYILPFNFGSNLKYFRREIIFTKLILNYNFSNFYIYFRYFKNESTFTVIPFVYTFYFVIIR